MAPHTTLIDLARLLDAELHGGDSNTRINGVAELSQARSDQVTLLTDRSRHDEAGCSPAAAFVVRRAIEALERPQLICSDPSRALFQLIEFFHENENGSSGSVDPRAAVDPAARVDKGATIRPFAVVEADAVVGAGAWIDPFCYVGRGAVIGQRARLCPGAVVMDGCSVGAETVVGPGAVVGYRGFGFFHDEHGWQPIRSVGSVELGPRTELGANSCVDRGTLGATRLGEGVKIDNLVQVGHNAQVEDHALLCGQAGLAGSARIGEGAILAGQVGVADHRSVGAGARVGAQSGIARDVPDGASVSGSPTMDHRIWLRSTAAFARLGDLAQQVKALEQEVARLARPPAKR